LFPSKRNKDLDFDLSLPLNLWGDSCLSTIQSRDVEALAIQL